MILFFIALDSLDENDRDALDALFLRTNKQVIGMICRYMNISFHENRELVEDLAQEVYLKTIRYRSRFVGKPERYQNGCLIMIIRNVCINFMKRADTIQFLSIDEIAEDENGDQHGFDIADDIDIQSALVHSETIQFVKEAIDRLDSPAREIVIERFYQNATYEEIAEKYSMKKGTVGSVIHRSLKKIGKELKEYVEDNYGK